jgi:hypothetical protein
MLSQIASPVKPRTPHQRAQLRLLQDVRWDLAQDLKRAERRGEQDDVEFAQGELAKAQAQIDALTDGRGY